jgi:hypothetical protein
MERFFHDLSPTDLYYYSEINITPFEGVIIVCDDTAGSLG